MALLLLPSKHWLIALVPLSVACAALVWPGKESSQDDDSNNQTKTALSIPQSSKTAAEKLIVNENLSPEQPADATSNDIDSAAKLTTWQTMPGKLLATMKKLDSELTRRQTEVREMQHHLEKTLKINHASQDTESTLEDVQQEEENIDFKQTQLINHASSLLDSHETDLKRSMENAAKSIQIVEEQVKSYQETLDLMKKMAF
jgi:hypothetical protein